MPVKGPLVKKYGYLSLEVMSRLRNVFAETKEDSEIDITSITNFNEEYEKFWETVRRDYDYIVE